MPKRIKLTKNKYTLVDDDIAEILNQYKWQITQNGYARRVDSFHKKYFLMHREIMNLTKSDNYQVDHINGNKLDNRKCNLRKCISTENAMNIRKTTKLKSSKYKGISQIKSRYGKQWKARIGVNNKSIFLGWFKTEEEAYNAYKSAVDLYHKEFGYYDGKLLNIVDFNEYEELPRAKTKHRY